MTRPSPSVPPLLNDKAPARLHLDYLDGLRGLAALYVVLVHTGQDVTVQSHIGHPGRVVMAIGSLLNFGRFAVDIFIVLSGFCLMLPLAKSADGQLRGGVGEFLRRRATRILPPYYAALALSVLLLAVFPRYAPEWGPAFSPGALLSHLFLVHNLGWNWGWQLDPPMWSVSTEWEIYFVFALLLLPVWKRYGMAAALVTAFVVGFAPHGLAHHRFDRACLHFLALFAIGMAGALVGFSARADFRAWRRGTPWGLLTLLLTALLLLIIRGEHARTVAAVGAAFCAAAALAGRPHRLGAIVLGLPLLLYLASLFPPDVIGDGNAVDVLVGDWTVCLVLTATRFLDGERLGHQKLAAPVVALLRSRPVVALGTFSYSLYLTHDPLSRFIDWRWAILNLPPPVALACNFLIVVPLCLLFSYLFFLAFERPFLVRRTQEGFSEVARDAALSPTP